MADPVNGAEAEEELVDYEEEEAVEPDQAKTGDETAKRGYVGLHTAGFKEFLLKPEILRAITKNAFEHPSEGRYTRLHASCGTRCFTLPRLIRRSVVVVQCNISAFPALQWDQTCFVRPSLEWAKLLSLFCPSCSRSRSSLMKALSLQRLEL